MAQIKYVKFEADFSKLPNTQSIFDQFAPLVKVVSKRPREIIVSGPEEDIILLIFALKPYSIDQDAPLHCSYVEGPKRG